MRPRKVILVVNADEVQLGMQRFMLETRGYRVLVAQDATAALALHALGVDMVLGFAGKHDRSRGPGLDWSALCGSMKANAQQFAPILLVGPKLNADELHSADGLIVDERPSTVELMERVRVTIARKRGPRKAVVSEPALAMAGD